jgi:periplasmic divalent cation tolerance protein
MSADALMIYCTCPDRETALKIAGLLVDRRLAACVNITTPLTSVYRWEEKRETAEEVLLLIKSRVERYADLEQAILHAHPYELPEIIAVPVERGLPGYLHWIDQCTTTQQEN